MSFIIFNFPNKYILLILFYPIAFIIRLITEKNIKSKFFQDIYLTYLISCISRIIAIIPFLIIKIYNKFKKSNKSKKIINQIKAGKEEYLIFILIQIIDFLNILAYFTMDEDTYYFSRAFIFRYTFQFFLYGIVSLYIIQSGFYIHKIISGSLIIILGFIIDSYNFEDYFIDEIKSIILVLLDILKECLLYLYIKFLLDKRYYSPYQTCFFFGLMELFSLILVFLIGFKKNFICFKENCLDSSLVFDSLEKMESVSLEMLKIIPFTIVFSLLYFSLQLIISYFPVQYTVLCSTLGQCISYIKLIITEDDLGNKFQYFMINILPSIFILISFFIYEEIIELNFWNLNYDTKRNLLIRMKKENKDEENEEGRNSLVELSEGYLVDPSGPINN